MTFPSLRSKLGGGGGSSGGSSVVIGDITVTGSMSENWFGNLVPVPFGGDGDYTYGFIVKDKFIGVETDMTIDGILRCNIILRNSDGTKIESHTHTSWYYSTYWDTSWPGGRTVLNTSTGATRDSFYTVYDPDTEMLAIGVLALHGAGVRYDIDLVNNTVTKTPGTVGINRASPAKPSYPVDLTNVGQDYQTKDGLIRINAEDTLSFINQNKDDLRTNISGSGALNGLSATINIDPSNEDNVLVTGYLFDKTYNSNKYKYDAQHKKMNRESLDNYLKALYLINGGVL